MLPSYLGSRKIMQGLLSYTRSEPSYLLLGFRSDRCLVVIPELQSAWAHIPGLAVLTKGFVVSSQRKDEL